MGEPADRAVTDVTAVAVDESADAVVARHAAERVAAAEGFEADAVDDIGLVATELAANIHEHGGGGTLAIKAIEDTSHAGIRLESVDAGPGIQDVETAFTSGASTAGSLGLGLAIVNQLMDEVKVSTPEGAGAGTRLVAERWLAPERACPGTSPAQVGAASRAVEGEAHNGDAFVVKTWDDRTLVCVIDGLGHGPLAHRAATAARNYVEAHFDRPLSAIFQGADRACKGTRGVVMAVARFDWAAETLTLANVGNIAARAAGPDRTGFVVRRGVVGGNHPEPSVVTRDWRPEYTMVLHSDGISTRWDWDDLRGAGDGSAGGIANWLLRTHGKAADDATALVVTEADD